jgi:Predicted transmembrane transcriptional regulator (anti-sigma factor)
MIEPKVHCPDWEEKLSLYVDGVLNPFDENAVEAHIARCASCRATVELWRAVGQSVRRLPRELPPPYLREAILASTTRRRAHARRWLPSWRTLAPALGVALLLAWLTLPRPALDRTPTMATATVPLPRAETTLPLVSAPTETTKAEPSPRTPLVILLHSSPAYRTASPAPRWTPHTRLSPAPTPQESAPPIIVWSDPAPRFAPTDTTRSPIITEIADTSESDLTPPLPAIATTNLPPTEPTPAAATRDLTDWLVRLNQQLREEDRQRIAGTARREPNRGAFFVPIVSVDLK